MGKFEKRVKPLHTEEETHKGGESSLLGLKNKSEDEEVIF